MTSKLQILLVLALSLISKSGLLPEAREQQWGAWNGRSVGSATSQIYSLNSKPLGSATGNMSSWNGLSLNLAAGNSYATDFAATESPLSESGHWINGKTTGLDWSDCASVLGVAYGTQPAHAEFATDDSTCVLTGTWGPNQMAQATVFVNPPLFFGDDEVELRLNSTISPHSIDGYEIAWGNSGYVMIVRWDADPSFSFHILSQVNSPGLIHGASFKATNVNGRITAYVNGAEITHATDTMYTAGSPGIGFFHDGVGNGNDAQGNLAFGLSHFSATDQMQQ
jgi:hypothetical protein